MTRIKLEFPANFCFQTEIPVRITDLNYGNHLANDKLLGIIHEARVRFFNSFDCSEFDIFGTGIILTDSVIMYKSQGFYNDILKIEIAVSDLHKLGCDIFYRITNKKSGKEIAKAKTGILFFDYKKQKPANTPSQFIEIFKN